jgi:hypothetical protein
MFRFEGHGYANGGWVTRERHEIEDASKKTLEPHISYKFRISQSAKKDFWGTNNSIISVVSFFIA